MQWLSDMIVGAARWLMDLFSAILALFMTVFSDVACYVLEGLCTVAITIVKAFDFSGILGYVETAWTSIPADIVSMASLLGINQAMSIIGSALLIRVVLQLIPFTRLGS